MVLQKACGQLPALAASPAIAPIKVAVNISARQLRRPQVVCPGAGLAGGGSHRWAETSILENVDDTIAKMNVLKAHGVTFALNHFGTGYYSLAYLKLCRSTWTRSTASSMPATPTRAAPYVQALPAHVMTLVLYKQRPDLGRVT